MSESVQLMHSVREDKAHLLIVKDCFLQGIFSDIVAIYAYYLLFHN